MADDDGKTEKPTAKRRAEARNKGQVAKSQEINTFVVLAAGIGSLAITGPSMFRQLQAMLSRGLTQAGDPSLASMSGIGQIFRWAGSAFVTAAAPIIVSCVVAGVVANVAQVRFKVTPKAIKPNFKKINPLAGFKRIFGKASVVEAAKAILKTVAVGGVGFLALYPAIPTLAGLVGLPPAALLGKISGMSLGIAIKVVGAFGVIAAGDWVWQKRKHEKSLKMTREEIKKEHKESDSSPEMKNAQRKKRAEMSRRRMLTEVPTADVVVVNPTHFAVALRYDGKHPAPQVVAKGQDLIAAAIRKVAEESGVPVLANPPLARALFRDVELDGLVPEELFAAVAEILAFVYRTAGRRSAENRRRAVTRAIAANATRAA